MRFLLSSPLSYYVLLEIEPKPGMAIMLIIESFSTELRHDYLIVSQLFQLGDTMKSARMYRSAVISSRDRECI